MDEEQAAAAFDRWFERVIALASQRDRLEPERFLESAAALRGEWDGFCGALSAALWSARLESALAHRFDLVDEPEEYAAAGHEVATAALILPDDALLLGPALKAAVQRLSGELTTEGVAPVFGMLLKRLKQVARSSGDAELGDWVRQVVGMLPD